MPMATRPYQEHVPFWYPGSPRTAGRSGMSLMWPGKIDDAAYEQYLQAWERHKGDEIRTEGPDGEPRVVYSMQLAIAPTESEAQDIARRGMEGLVRRARQSHRLDHLVVSPEEGEAAQGPLRAIIANVDIARPARRRHAVAGRRAGGDAARRRRGRLHLLHVPRGRREL